jgi:hypothetical protein
MKYIKLFNESSSPETAEDIEDYFLELTDDGYTVDINDAWISPDFDSNPNEVIDIDYLIKQVNIYSKKELLENKQPTGYYIDVRSHGYNGNNALERINDYLSKLINIKNRLNNKKFKVKYIIRGAVDVSFVIKKQPDES